MGWLLFAPVLPLGRMRRLAFIASYLIIVAASFGAAHFAGTSTLAMLVLALSFWPQFCISARRLHDIGGSAFWMVLVWVVAGVCLVFGGVAVVNGLVNLPPGQPVGANQEIAAMSGIGLVAGIFALVVLVGFFLFLCVWPSSKKAKYGPPLGAPKAPAPAA